MASNLDEVRKAAELYKSGEGKSQERFRAFEQMADYILATIPANPTAPITPEWLREVWGFDSPISGAWNHSRINGTFCFEDGGLSWWHVGNRTATITTRHQFTQLANALGLQPKGDV